MTTVLDAKGLKCPLPVLRARIATGRGCFETGDNPIYQVGEQFGGALRIDALNEEVPIEAAQVRVFEVFPNNTAVLTFQSMLPTGQTFGFAGTVSPPPGLHTLRAEAVAEPYEAAFNCTFRVVAAATPTAVPTGTPTNSVSARWARRAMSRPSSGSSNRATMARRTATSSDALDDRPAPSGTLDATRRSKPRISCPSSRSAAVTP